LSGYWNDTDVSIVSKALVTECMSAAVIAEYTGRNNKKPVIIVGNIQNASDEHIDTMILAQKFEAALVNSGKVRSVANAMDRSQIRQEREDMQNWASDETVKRLAHEVGADFMLIGSVRTIVDSNQKQMTRVYYVHAELVNIESTEKFWIGDNSEIKKVISRPSVRG
jgi:PBP1b-binding outer membrane lipoprotein LpoB